MKQNDIPIVYVFQNRLFDGCFAVYFPVVGIYGPMKNGKISGLGNLTDGIPGESSRRTEKGRVAALRQQGLDRKSVV